MQTGGAPGPSHKSRQSHIAFIEVYKCQTFDVLQNIRRFEQTATPRIWQINLSDVASNNGFGVEPQTSDEHFHLLGGRVLRFVQNYERIVKRAPPHEGDG